MAAGEISILTIHYLYVSFLNNELKPFHCQTDKLL